jgi:hypothetical protein
LNVEPILSFFPIVGLHCKTLLSLFSHLIWLLNHFYRSSLFLTFTVKNFDSDFLIIFHRQIIYIGLLFCWLISKTLISLFSHQFWIWKTYIVFLYCCLDWKTLLSLFSHHLWLLI